jgi:hypothetical protein
MSEKTKNEELDLIEDITEVELQDESLVETVEVTTEEIVEEVAVEKPATKAGLLASIYEEMSKLDKTKLAKAYESILGEKVEIDDEDEESDEEESKESDEEDEDDEKVVVEKKKKGKVKESYDFKDDLDALVIADSTLSEEFQEKAGTIFETAVKSKITSEIERLEEEYAVQLQEESEVIKEGLVEKVDGYLNYVVESWMEDNKLAIEAGIRTEISESFMQSLKGLFTEHYIDVPESKVDLVDDLVEEVTSLEEQVNNMVGDNIKLTESVQLLKREMIIDEAAKDLAGTQSEKLKGLVEDLEFEDEKTFIKKVFTVKESYFSDKPSDFDVEKAEMENGSLAESVQLSSSMEKYSSVLSKTLK